MLSYHQPSRFPNGLVPSGLPTKYLRNPNRHPLSVLYTTPSSSSMIPSPKVKYLAKNKNYEAAQARFPTSRYFLPLRTQFLLSTLFSNIL